MRGEDVKFMILRRGLTLTEDRQKAQYYANTVLAETTDLHFVFVHIISKNEY